MLEKTSKTFIRDKSFIMKLHEKFCILKSARAFFFEIPEKQIASQMVQRITFVGQ